MGRTASLGRIATRIAAAFVALALLATPPAVRPAQAKEPTQEPDGSETRTYTNFSEAQADALKGIAVVGMLAGAGVGIYDIAMAAQRKRPHAALLVLAIVFAAADGAVAGALLSDGGCRDQRLCAGVGGTLAAMGGVALAGGIAGFATPRTRTFYITGAWRPGPHGGGAVANLHLRF